MNIVIFTNKSCPYCKLVKDELIKENIEFENKDTTEYVDDWQNVAALTGMPQVPTIYFKNKYWTPGRDFNSAPQLVSSLKQYKELPFSTEIQMNERIKTWYYHMSMAFNKTDKILKQIENKLNIKDEHKSAN